MTTIIHEEIIGGESVLIVESVNTYWNVGTKFKMPYQEDYPFTISSIQGNKVTVSYASGSRVYGITEVDKLFNNGDWVAEK